MEIKPVAHIYTDFPTKFGVPRQSGLVEELKGKIVFEPFYRDPEAVKGLEKFSHIWVLWDFSSAHRKEGEWAATACPPRLGGKTHIGIWATRAPFRPNNIGLSSLRLDSIEFTEKGPVLNVSGIDMMNGTPIYDIKPYIRFDSHPDAVDGFVEETHSYALEVRDPENWLDKTDLSAMQKSALLGVLSEDPRPSFDADDSGKRRYGFYYEKYDVRFTVCAQVLSIVEIVLVR